MTRAGHNFLIKYTLEKDYYGEHIRLKFKSRCIDKTDYRDNGRRVEWHEEVGNYTRKWTPISPERVREIFKAKPEKLRTKIRITIDHLFGG